MIKSKLEIDLRKFRTTPFLFIGSGFSRRYLGNDDWRGILQRFCEPYINSFEYYYSKASGNLPTVASLMSKDFFDIWWKSTDFSESRTAYSKYGNMENMSSPLKYEISQYLKSRSLNNSDPKLSKEIESLKKVVIDGIITTNWDLLIEDIFSDYDVYVSQDELISSNLQEICEIYKIHGSISDFNSLILTKEDYENFDGKNPYLVSKLLTLFIEHPIIFIGYSIQDENIKTILKSISFCLQDKDLNKIVNNLFIVEPIFDECEDTYEKTFINIDKQNIPVTLIKVKDYCNIYQPLSYNRRKLSVKQLQQLKSSIYEIVKTNDPKGKLLCVDINDRTNLNDVDFVLGVGVVKVLTERGKIGYKSYEYDDIIRDIVLDNLKLDCEEMVQVTLPQCLKNQYRTPFYKYLRLAGYLTSGTKKEIPKKIKNHMGEIKKELAKHAVSDLIKDYKRLGKVLEYDYTLKNPNLLKACIRSNGKGSIDVERLYKLLVEKIDNVDTPTELSNSRTICRIYDWLKNS